MTAEELIKHFNTTFKLGEWPKTYEVDLETYENCEKYILDWMKERQYIDDPILLVGPNLGLMFKNVELILKCQ